MHRIQIRQREKKCRQSLLSTFLPSNLAAKKTTFRRQNLRGPRQVLRLRGRKLYLCCAAGTSAAAEWCKENLKWAGGPGAPLDFRGPELRDMAALRGPQASYPAQILQFQMSTQS